LERDVGEGDITEGDIRERDIGEREIRETVATCRFNQQLLIHIHIHIDIHIRGVSGCLSFLHSWHRRARFLGRHKPQILQPTDGISLRSSSSWARLRCLWPWGRRRRFWPWGMLAHPLALLR
jgi:hypothetical protein